MTLLLNKTPVRRILPTLLIVVAGVAAAANPFGKSSSVSSQKPFGKTKTCADPEAPITVKILKRNLDIPGAEVARSLSENAVHYHAVAYGFDGTYIGDFGWTGEGSILKDFAGSKGRMFQEPTENRFFEDYDSTPVAEANVTFGDWELAKKQFEYNEDGSGYKLTNNGVGDYHNPAMAHGKEAFNCQFAMSRFWNELKNTQSFQPVEEFEWPGGNVDTLTFLDGIRKAAVATGRNDQPESGEQALSIDAPNAIDMSAMLSLCRQVLAHGRSILAQARTLLASANTGGIPQTQIEQYNALKKNLRDLLPKLHEQMQKMVFRIDSLPLSDAEKARFLDRSVPEETRRHLQAIFAETKAVANEILEIESDLKNRYPDMIKFVSLDLDSLPQLPVENASSTTRHDSETR